MTDQDTPPSGTPARIDWQGLAKTLFLNAPWSGLWSLVMAVGGTLLLVFICRLGFLPDMNLGDVTSVLASMALVGMAVIAVFMMMLVLPGVATRHLLNESIRPAKGPGDAPPAIQPTSPVEWVLIVLGPTLATIFLLAVVINSPADNSHIDVWLPIILGVHVTLTIVKFGFYDRLHRRRLDAIERGVLSWLAGLCWFVATMLVTQITMLLARDNPDITTKLSAAQITVAGVVLLLGIICANVILVLAKKVTPWKLALGIAFTLLFLLMGITQNYAFVSQTTAERLGLAQRHPTSLVVTKTGCAAIQGALGHPTLCVVDGKTDLATVCPVRIRSRLGNQVVLEVSRVDFNDKGELIWNVGESARQVMIRKEDVLSWGAPQPRPLPDQGKRCSTGPTQGLASMHTSAHGDEAQADVERWCQPYSSAPASSPTMQAPSASQPSPCPSKPCSASSPASTTSPPTPSACSTAAAAPFPAASNGRWISTHPCGC